MDPTRFDELTRALASATSRRQAMRQIGGILLWQQYDLPERHLRLLSFRPL